MENEIEDGTDTKLKITEMKAETENAINEVVKNEATQDKNAPLNEAKTDGLVDDDVTSPEGLDEKATNKSKQERLTLAPERPSCCRVITENISFIVNHINSVDTIALRLFKENILPEINCNSIVQNLKKRGPICAADELVEFLYHDPDLSHHRTFYRFLEETGQQELADTLRNRTTESGCSGKVTGQQSRATVADPINLTDSDIAEEIREGKTPVYVTMGFASDSMTRMLQGIDLLPFLDELKRMFITNLEEHAKLRHILKKYGKLDCIMQLNSYLQKKTKEKLNKLIAMLREMRDVDELASFIEVVLVKCEDVSKLIGPVYSQSECFISAQVKIKSSGTRLPDGIMEKMKAIPDDLLEFLFCKAHIKDIQNGCVEINFDVKNRWELENLQKSVDCGLFSQRFRLWLKRKNFEISSETQFEITLMTSPDTAEPNSSSFEKTMAHHKEEDTVLGACGNAIEVASAEMQKKKTVDEEGKVVLANPNDLSNDDMSAEYADGRSPVYVTLEFVSESIVKTLDGMDLTTLFARLQEKTVLEPGEVQQLQTCVANDMDIIDCILQLNMVLQKKTEVKIMELIAALKKIQQTNTLANLIESVLYKCQDANLKGSKARTVTDEIQPCISEDVIGDQNASPSMVALPGTSREQWQYQGLVTEGCAYRPPQYTLLDELKREQKRCCLPEELVEKIASRLQNIDILGNILGFNQTEMEQFEKYKPLSVPSQALKMLYKWKERKGEKATVKRLVRAFQYANIPEHYYKKAIVDHFRHSGSHCDDSISSGDA